MGLIKRLLGREKKHEEQVVARLNEVPTSDVVYQVPFQKAKAKKEEKQLEDPAHKAKRIAKRRRQAKARQIQYRKRRGLRKIAA